MRRSLEKELGAHWQIVEVLTPEQRELLSIFLNTCDATVCPRYRSQSGHTWPYAIYDGDRRSRHLIGSGGPYKTYPAYHYDHVMKVLKTIIEKATSY